MLILFSLASASRGLTSTASWRTRFLVDVIPGRYRAWGRSLGSGSVGMKGRPRTRMLWARARGVRARAEWEVRLRNHLCEWPVPAGWGGLLRPREDHPLPAVGLMPMHTPLQWDCPVPRLPIAYKQHCTLFMPAGGRSALRPLLLN